MKTKTFLPFTFVYLLLSLAIILSCKDAKHIDTKDDPQAQMDSSSVKTESSTGESNASNKIQGRGIRAAEADVITKQYYTEQDAIANNGNYSKSVYFKASELQDFLDAIVETNKELSLCTAEELGVRIYFAKYPQVSTTYPYPGQQTVVLRATCDGKDIRHQINQDESETVFVAYNFGDVCPPRCVPGSTTNYPNAGKYNINGNCVGCPQ